MKLDVQLEIENSTQEYDFNTPFMTLNSAMNRK